MNIPVCGRLALAQTILSHNRGGYDVCIQIRPTTRGDPAAEAQPAPYQNIYLSVEDQLRGETEEEAIRAAVRDIPGIEIPDVNPYYIPAGLEQVLDIPGLQCPLGDSSAPEDRALRDLLFKDLEELGHQMMGISFQENPLKHTPIAWSLGASVVMMGDETLCRHGQVGHLTRDVTSCFPCNLSSWRPWYESSQRHALTSPG